MLDRDTVADQRQVLAQQRPGGGVEPERALLDQRHDGHGGEALRPARHGELRVDGRRDAVGSVRQPVCRTDHGVTLAVDPDRPGEAGALGDLGHFGLQGGHGRSG